MTTEPCPICSEFRYISLVRVCPICGAPGKLPEVSDTAEKFLRRLEIKRIWETVNFEEIWESIKPARADPGHCFCEAP